jgi:hypothetical protein
VHDPAVVIVDPCRDKICVSPLPWCDGMGDKNGGGKVASISANLCAVRQKGKGGSEYRRVMRRTWVIVLLVVEVADDRKDTHGDDDYDCEPIYCGVCDGEKQPVKIPRCIEELPSRKWNGVVYLRSMAAPLDSSRV